MILCSAFGPVLRLQLSCTIIADTDGSVSFEVFWMKTGSVSPWSLGRPHEHRSTKEALSIRYCLLSYSIDLQLFELAILTQH